MRTLFWLLTLFALAVGVSLAFGDNDGYVLIALPPWRAEVSLNFFVVVLVLGFVLGHVLLRFLVHTLNLPRTVRAYRARRRREMAQRALHDAVLQLYEGRYGHALKNAARVHAAGEAQALSALLAARAAHFLRDNDREREWLERAAEHDSEAQSARLMTEAELHIERRRFEAALAALDAMQEKGRRHIAALRLALRAHRELGHWDDVLRVARQLEKAHGMTQEGAAPLKLRAHQEALRARAGDAPALAAYWQAVPAKERYVPQLAATAARVLIDAGDGPLAQRVIESQLEEAWDSELAELYADCQGGDMLARIARAEKWLVRQPHDARLLLALGRLCRAQQLWGKAQSYFEASLAVKPNQDAHAELAALFDQLGRHEEASQSYRNAAALCVRPNPSA